MILLFLLVIFCFVPSFPYMSDRFSSYEELIYFSAINSYGKTPESYPLETDSNITVFENKYFQYLCNMNRFEKTFSDNLFFLEAVLGGVHSDSMVPVVEISPKIKFKMNDRLSALASAFFSNDISNNRGFPVKQFKDKIIAGFERGYIKWSDRNLNVLIGRIDCHSSFSPDRSLIFDYSAPPMDGIFLRQKLGRFSYEFKYLFLGSMKLDSTYFFEQESVNIVSRRLSYHRFTYSPKNWLHMSFSESVIFGRASIGNPLDYTFPFFIFYGEQNNIDINDNILWTFDISYNIKGKLNLTYSFLVDDYQYEYEGVKDLEPPELGHLARADIPFSSGIVAVSILRVNAWVYNQRYPWNKYEINNKNIGIADGPDIQGFELTAKKTYSEKGALKLKASYFIKGDNYTKSNWIFPTTDMYYYYTHIGIEPVKRIVSAEASIGHILNFLYLEASGGFARGLPERETKWRASLIARILI